MLLKIEGTWDGLPVSPHERAAVRLTPSDGFLQVGVEAPYWRDPRPPSLPGPTDRLWEYEVVELFILGSEERYLEVELGPHGHYLVLALAGRRNVVKSGLQLDYEASLEDARWRGRARIPWAFLPPAPSRCNAYHIHGVGSARRYLAAFPVPGERPDFHRLDCFAPFEL